MTYIRRLILALALSAGLAPAFAQVPPPVPALPDTERRTSYSITASLCSCNVGFALYGDGTDYSNWIEVFVNGVRMAQAGNWTLSSVTGTIGSIPLPITNAVLTFNGVQTGTVQIVGARRPRRTSQFNEGAGVPTRNFNVVLSDLTAQNRELWDKTNDVTGRALISQPGNTLSMLPLPSACGGKFLGFDPTGLIPQCNAGGVGSGNVIGPVSTTVGHIAQWNNTTGTLLADNSAITGNYTFAGDMLFGSGRPWCDVRAKGAVGDGVTNDQAAFDACKAVVYGFGGGTIYVPPGNYCVFSGLNFDTGSGSNGDVQLIGSGVRYSAISACGHDVIVLRFNNQFSKASTLAIYGYGMQSGDTVGAQTLPAFSLGSGCTYCVLEHSYVAGGTQAISNQANYSFFEHVTAQYSYGGVTNGTANFYNINSGPLIISSSFDQVFPFSQPAHGTAAPIARANTTGYSAGALVTITCNAKTYVWQATVGGTSGGSQPACKIYGQAVTDGTVTWKLTKPGTFYAVQVDTGSNELKLSNVDMTGSFDAGLALTNSFAGAIPQATTVTDSTIGGTFSQGIWASAGTGLDVHNLEVSSCILAACKAIHLDTGWSGTTHIIGGRIINSVSYGVYNGGGTNLSVMGMSVQTADTAALNVVAAVSKFTFSGNNLGYASNTNAITVAVGASDNYNIIGNNVIGAGTTVVDGGSGTNKVVGGNDGPWSIGSGGTGAVTAAAARTALGLAIGTDVQAFDADLAALAANSTNGLWAHTGAGTGSARTITGTSGQITVTNGDGVSGNPTLTIGAIPAFSVHKNAVDQTGVADSTFTAVTWGTEIYDVGSFFASNAWTPPAGKIHLDCSLFISATVVTGNQIVISIFKNGAGYKNATWPASSIIGGGAAFVGADDIANGSDVYTIQVFVDTSSGTATVSGATTNTFFTGHWISP